MLKLVPDLYCDTVYDIDIDALRASGVRAILSDIDNTLEPYEIARPEPRLLEWISSIRAAGISLAFVSNNGEERVALFNKELGLPAVANAHKPMRGALLRLMKELGAEPRETVMLGDQIFTDVLAGRLAGTGCILVKPIKDRTDLLTRSKRALEKPVLRTYARREARKKSADS